MRHTAPLLLLPLLAACGQAGPAQDVARPAPAAAADQSPAEQHPDDQPPAELSPADAGALLAGVPAAAQAAGSVRYASVTELTPEGGPTEVEGRLSGVLDLATGAGTGRLQLPALDDLAAEAEAAGEAAAELDALADLTLSWTGTEVTAVVDGQRHSAPRDGADTGVLGRVPLEPAGLLEVVAAATDVAVAGQQDVDGIGTTRVTGTVEPQAAVDAGLGTQAELTIAGLPSLPVEVWVDREGRPARIRFTADVPSRQGAPRTMTTTYDDRGWGEPVDVTP